MDILSDEFPSKEQRPVTFSVWLQKIPGYLRRLTRFFVLSEEELSESGIMTGSDCYEGSSYFIEKIDHADTVL